MAHVTATRSELLARRSQIAFAEAGRDILRQKRDQLMEEFRKLADVVLTGADALDGATADARRHLALTEAAVGPEAVASAALATRAELPLRAGTTTVMGIRFADIDYDPVAVPATGRGYSLVASDARIDATADAFDTVVDLVLELASKELQLRRLVDEVGATTRRLNAIEWVVLPRLATERRAIQTILDEREREDQFRLKRFITTRRAREEMSA